MAKKSIKSNVVKTEPEQPKLPDPIPQVVVSAPKNALQRVKVTIEQLRVLQAEGKLVGWDPKNSIAIIKGE